MKLDFECVTERETLRICIPRDPSVVGILTRDMALTLHQQNNPTKHEFQCITNSETFETCIPFSYVIRPS
jgi:hypothetical protein